MSSKYFRFVWLSCLLIFATLACNLFSQFSTSRDLRNTAEAITTQAEGFATQVSQGQVLQTAQALATREGPKLLATAQGLTTQAAESGIQQTAQAYVTQEGGDMLATLQAFITQSIPHGDPPEDIPLIEPKEDLENFIANDSIVTYYTTVDYQTVLDFYKEEMPNNSWKEASFGNSETDNSAFLNFEKDERRAMVALSYNPFDGKTVVMITLMRK